MSVVSTHYSVIGYYYVFMSGNIYIFERKAKNVQIFNRPLLLGRLGDLYNVLVTWSVVVSGGGCVLDRGQSLVVS